MSLTPTPSFIASILVFTIGVVIVWSNPGRSVNRAVFSASCNIALWLASLYVTTAIVARGTPQALSWFRATCTIGAFVPLQFLIVKDAIDGTIASRRIGTFIRWGVWLLISILLSYLPQTEYFISSQATAGGGRLPGYYAYIVWNLALYVTLLIETFRAARKVTGAQRVELQLWLLGGCLMTTVIFACMLLGELTGSRNYIVYFQPSAVLAFYAATVITITTSRIFDARQVVLVGLQKIILVAIVAFVAYFLDTALNSAFGDGAQSFEYLVLFTDAAITLWVAFTLNAWLNKTFRFYPQDTEVRQAAYAAARHETQAARLEQSFLAILKGWGKADRAVLLSGSKTELRGSNIDLAGDSPIPALMAELKWATPERLHREKPTPERALLGKFLQEQRLGVLVFSDGPTHNVLAGVGVPASRRPYTYPQVTQLIELSAIIESALERAHFLVKAQHAEQLATVGLLGASLAHEIRNPLVSIKTFVQLLPKHYQDEAFRDKFFRLISDEVGRIDRLTEQLLDMATPRVYSATPLHLHPLLKSSLDLVAAKADDRQIKLISDFEATPDLALTDATATKQVLLNLCFNAIHAVENRDGDRWIKVATRNVGESIEVAVFDNGPGIAADVLPKLFQPFQTTKSTGFGLGLAICSDILSGLKATIVADPPRPGTGATFRVRFPCPPLSS